MTSVLGANVRVWRWRFGAGSAAVAAAAAIAACGSTHAKNASDPAAATGTVAIPATGTVPGSRTSTSGSGTRSVSVPAGQWNAASLFADAYVRFLEGARSASQLPYASASVRQQAALDGPIPARARTGTLKLVSLEPTSDTDSFSLIARDGAHSFSAQEQLAHTRTGWVVVSLIPPDYDQSLVRPGPGPAALPSGSTAAHTAAVTFLKAYLPWLYGHGSITSAKDGTATLIAHLKADPPNIPPAMSNLHGRATAVGMQKHGAAWLAQANVTDADSTYQLTLTVVQQHGEWLVSGVSSP